MAGVTRGSERFRPSTVTSFWNHPMTKAQTRAASSEELVRRFEETAIIHRELRTPREANRAFDEGVAIWRELKQRGTDAVRIFLTLLGSDNAAVRMNAACLALFDAPTEAEAV